MRKLIKFVLFFFSGLVLLLSVVAVALIFLFDLNDYKPQLQAAASDALGMEVSVGGRLGLGLYPGVRFTIKDVKIHNQEKELVTVEEIRVGLELLPLLQKQYRLKSISLIQPRVAIERGLDGNYNFYKSKSTGKALPVVELAKLSVFNGVFNYLDRRSGYRYSAKFCDLGLLNLRFGGEGKNSMQSLSFMAKLFCRKIRIKEYSASNLKFSVDARNGLFDVKPITLDIFSGEGAGSVRADFSRATPHYNVSFALPRFRIEEPLKTQTAKTVLSGPMSFSMNLSLHGESAQQIKKSASGEVALQGKNLKLHGHDLDLEFDRYESSQNFNMLDMGALFIAGPVGMAVTKGHDFASVLAGSGGVSNIRTFVSRWRVKRGVMYAQDVAMATSKHRMALLGGLDIAHERFIDVTLALINSRGCAVVQQKISGPFGKPVLQQPSVIKSVAGPVLKLFKKGRKLLSGDKCKVIYAGSVTPTH